MRARHVARSRSRVLVGTAGLGVGLVGAVCVGAALTSPSAPRPEVLGSLQLSSGTTPGDPTTGALFGESDLTPGHPVARCTTVVGAGDDGPVALEAREVQGALAANLRVVVTGGTGTDRECGDFVASGPAFYSGTLADLAATTSSLGGTSTGWRAATRESRTFQVSVEVLDVPAAVGASVTADFAWTNTGVRALPVPVPPTTDPPSPTTTAPTTDPVTAPTTDPVTPPTTEPATAPTTDPVTPATTEPPSPATTAPTTDPVTPPTTAPTTAPTTRPPAGPTSVPTTEPTGAPPTVAALPPSVGTTAEPAVPTRTGPRRTPGTADVPAPQDTVSTVDPMAPSQTATLRAPQRTRAAGAAAGTTPPRSGTGAVREVVDEVFRVSAALVHNAPLPLLLFSLVLLYLLVQDRIDRRDPKLADAPISATPDQSVPDEGTVPWQKS